MKSNIKLSAGQMKERQSNVWSWFTVQFTAVHSFFLLLFVFVSFHSNSIHSIPSFSSLYPLLRDIIYSFYSDLNRFIFHFISFPFMPHHLFPFISIHIALNTASVARQFVERVTSTFFPTGGVLSQCLFISFCRLSMSSAIKVTTFRRP